MPTTHPANNQPTLRTALLRNTQAGSNKVYQLWLVGTEQNGYQTLYANGPFGGTLTYGAKTLPGCTLDVATAKYDAVLKEKTKGGYVGTDAQTVNEASGAPAIYSIQANNATGVLPHLPVALTIEEGVIAMMHAKYLAQEKHDGERRLLSVDEDGNVTAIGRLGNRVPVLPNQVYAMKRLHAKSEGKSWLIDGEIVGERFVAFDVRRARGESIEHRPFVERVAELKHLEGYGAELCQVFGHHDADFDVDLHINETVSLFLATYLKRGEGLVLKDPTAPYVEGKASPTSATQFKVKFVETATVRVSQINTDRRSVAIEGFDPNENNWQRLGNVTVPEKAVVAVGDLIEVGYLYVMPRGSLIQPTYKGLRTDLMGDMALNNESYFKSHTSLSFLKLKAERNAAGHTLVDTQLLPNTTVMYTSFYGRCAQMLEVETRDLLDASKLIAGVISCDMAKVDNIFPPGQINCFVHKMTLMPTKEMAQIAYKAYADAHGFKQVDVDIPQQTNPNN